MSAIGRGVVQGGERERVSAKAQVSPLRQRMVQDMDLAGLTAGSQTAYIRAVLALQKHAGVRPDRLSEQEVYKYIVWLREVRGVAKGTFLGHFHGLKFFYYRCLGRDWGLFNRKKVRLPRQARLPKAISPEECRRLIAALRKPVYRVCCASMYALGLRCSDALGLRVQAIDSRRMVVRLIGKGNKERSVPLPEAVLLQWRGLWKTHRHPVWLFPNAAGTRQLNRKGLYKAFLRAREQAGLGREITLHSLRHGFATRLLERGVDIRSVQILLGHASLRSTEIYTHLTLAMQGGLRAHLNEMFGEACAGGLAHGR